MKAFKFGILISCLTVLLLNVTVAHAESTQREGYVRIPALETSTNTGSVYLMMDNKQTPSVTQAPTQRKSSFSKIHCIAQPQRFMCF